jgi:uncharacterized repeat protein (TIGR01451 family)
MKNNIKKIIVGIISFAILLSAQGVFAAGVTWNQASNDCKSLSIVNATTLQGYQNPCWPLSTVSADKGQLITVRIYYHNTGTVTATNTRLMLTPNTALGNSSTTKSFTGRITSDQGSVSISQYVTANLSSSQSLTLSSVEWYTNNEALTPLLGSPSSVLTSAGLPIGDIPVGWSSQGSLAVSFRISNNVTPQPACSISNFTANPTSITKGNSSTLSWNTSNCTSVSISNIVNVNNSGSQAVYPTSTKTYTLTAYNSTGSPQTKTVKISVTIPPPTSTCTINNFQASPKSITSGDSSTLSWSTSNCTAIVITPNIGNQNPSGSEVVYPTTNTTYTLKAYSSSGTLSDTDTANVNVSTISNMTGNLIPTFSSCQIAQGNSGCAIPFTWITNNPESVSSITHNGSTVASGNSGSQSFGISYGSQTYYLYNNSKLLDTKTVSASCASGTSWNGSYCAPITNPTPTCTINNFQASPTSITSGDSSTLSWSTSNCTSVAISSIGYGLSTSGSRSVYPTSTKTYTLTAYGTGGEQNSSVNVYVDENNNDCRISSFSASDDDVDYGDYVTLRWNTNDCDRVKISNIGYVSEDGDKRIYVYDDETYTLTAYNEDGSSRTRTVRIYVDENNNNNDYCSIDSFTTDKIYVNSGEAVTMRWNTTDCVDVNISGIGYVVKDGSRVIYPNTTRTYTLRARGDNTEERSITINVNYNPPVIPTPVIYNDNVVTIVATNISQTSAQFNGLVTSSNYSNTNAYFKYGTTVNLGLTTTPKTISNNTNFSDYISGLNPNTIYYFRAVSEGPNGISNGAIEVFKTLPYNITPTPITKTIVVQGEAVSDSPIMLSIENKYQNIGVGDIVDYTVNYKNIGKSKLTKPMIQVFIPKGITLINTSKGVYSEGDRTLSVPIDDLEKNDEGVIYLQGRVDSIDSNLAQIVTTTILIYTNKDGAQENAMAYVLNTPKSTNLLGASAFFGNLFEMSLIGWLLLIIFIMLLILISKSFSRNKKINTGTHIN